MTTKIRIMIMAIFLFIGLSIYPLTSQAVWMIANATGGTRLDYNNEETTDGWNGDYVAEATHNSPVAPYHDQGYAKTSLTSTGIELKSRSYAPDLYANSHARIIDQFTVTTVSGISNAVYDAVLNFRLTGFIEILTPQNHGEGSFSVDMYARRGSFNPLLDSKEIRYIVSWNNTQYQGFNNNDNDNNDLFQVYPTVAGLTYTFDIPLSLNLNEIKADGDPVMLELRLWSHAMNGVIVDFSNTLKTDHDNPFVITSSLPGSSCRLVTDSDYENFGVSLFGSLDGEIVSGNPVPLPSTIFLLISGLAGLIGINSRKKS